MKLKTKIRRIWIRIKYGLRLFLRVLAFVSFSFSLILIMDTMVSQSGLVVWKIYDKTTGFEDDDKFYSLRYHGEGTLALKKVKVTEELYSLIRENDELKVKISRFFNLPHKYILKRYGQILYSKSDFEYYLVFWVLALFLWIPLFAFNKYFEVDISYKTMAIVGSELISIAGWIYLISINL